MTGPFDLQRFLDAQSLVYPRVLDELRPQPGSYPVKRPALATNGSELIALSIRKKEVRSRNR
jgi:hypothetical protein